MKRRLLLILALALPLLIYLPTINQFALSASSTYSDLLISHYPNALFLARGLTQWHVIPLWSNTILSGYPFFANPLSGLWYFPGWLALISLPQPWGFNLTVLIHLFAGGLGFFLFMRQRNCSTTAALLGALAFEAMPKLAAHWAAGHVTLIYAICWTPWLLWAEKKRSTQNTPRIYRFLPGVILGMIALADVRWLPLAGSVWGIYGLAGLLRSPNKAIKTRQWLSLFLQLILQPVIAFLIAAPLLLPMLEYIPLTTRHALSPSDGLAISLPPAKLLGLLMPELGGYAEWVVYPGALVLFMVILNLASPALRPKNWGWLVLSALSLIFSLGELIPGMDWLVSLPGLNLLRAPSRAMFLFGFSAAVLTSAGMDWLIHEPKWGFDPAFFMTPFPVFSILLAGGLWFVNHEVALNFIWGAVALTLALILVFAGERQWLPRRVWLAAVMILLLGDLVGVNAQAATHQDLSTVLNLKDPAAEYLTFALSQSSGRLYSPSYSVQQQTAAYLGFELADGVDPMQLTAYSDYMEGATGVSSAGYSVTLPAFDGDPQTANRLAVPNARELGWFNIQYIVAAYPLDVPDLEFQGQFGYTYIYSNPLARPRAWVEVDQNTIRSVEQMTWSPNRISIEAEGPGLLVLSEQYYPGWIAAIDSLPAQIKPVSGTLRGVELPPGDHTVEFYFLPLSVYIGLALSLVIWISLAVIGLKRSK